MFIFFFYVFRLFFFNALSLHETTLTSTFLFSISPQPILTSKLRMHDTCGVHNLHGMPAIISAIFSAIYASLATTENYKDSITEIFPAMNWKNSTFAMEHNTTIIGVRIFLCFFFFLFYFCRRSDSFFLRNLFFPLTFFLFWNSFGFEVFSEPREKKNRSLFCIRCCCVCFICLIFHFGSMNNLGLWQNSTATGWLSTIGNNVNCALCYRYGYCNRLV